MTIAFVVDCSVALTWLFSDEATTQTTDLLDRLSAETALVPSLWFLEIANVLALAERKGRISSQQSAEFIAAVQTLGIKVETDAPLRAFEELLPLCRDHALTSYDAVYLDLAQRQNLPLATLDGSLRKAAEKLNIVLLGL